ncbi:terminase small subunit [Geomicrobium sediminis]|uniref:Phage terminase small subunit n=1 Tax=Geomicrobium sediminis TaxID=1347788 RepID=A0ABS2PFF6_9BACL|nr:terminase small subunit [Geomicrobium sediminis]MBM7634064.1 phage terminase small subunit [Geomicrobium sediminis]
MKMTEKQRRFADYFIEYGNAHKAALEAGYSETYARTDSHTLLENPRIKPYIDERLQQLQSERVADQQEIMEFLSSVMRGKVTEPVPILNGDGYQKVVDLVPGVNVRKAAAVDLGKRYAMWTDKQEVSVEGAVQFVDDIGDEDGG